MDNTYARGLKIHPWQSKMKVKSIPEEKEQAFTGNQDDYDAEDVSSGSKEVATWWRLPTAKSVDLDVGRRHDAAVWGRPNAKGHLALLAAMVDMAVAESVELVDPKGGRIR